MPYIKFNISRNKSDDVISFLKSELPSVEYEKFITRDTKSVGIKIYLDNFRQLTKAKRIKDDLGLTEQDIWDETFELTMDLQIWRWCRFRIVGMRLFTMSWWRMITNFMVKHG